MASVDWPWDLCSIRIGNYTLDDDENVRRTAFESGSISQKRVATRTKRTREFDVMVKVSNVDDFRGFIRDHGNDFFNFADWESAQVEPHGPRSRNHKGCSHPWRAYPSPVLEGDLLDGERYFTGTSRSRRLRLEVSGESPRARPFEPHVQSVKG